MGICLFVNVGCVLDAQVEVAVTVAADVEVNVNI